MVNRARIILCRAEGMSQVELAAEAGGRQPVVSKWDRRFRSQSLEGLSEALRSGRKPSLPEPVRESIITDATRPPAPRKRWSLRTMRRGQAGVPVNGSLLVEVQ